MNVPFDQKSLFASEKKPQLTTAQKVEVKNRPEISLTAGLDKVSLQADSIYTLRVTANQHLRNNNYEKFFETIACEISIKTGHTNVCDAVRNALLKRFVNG